jgi:cell division protein FtsA
MGRTEKIVVGLDVGSTKVCTLIADSQLNPIGVGVAESKGIKKGSIVNIEAAVDSIRKSVTEAEVMAGCNVEKVYVGLAGGHIKSFNSLGVTSIPTRSREINADDVRRVIETARAVALAPDREVIHILPQEFTVDDQRGIADPLGMFGTRLEVNVHIVTSSTTAAQNIVTAVNRSGHYVDDTVLEPIAVGEAMLGEDEKELGCVLVDIGGGKTNIAIYHRGAVRHTVVVPVGAELFTSDIAVGLRTSIPEAERLKRDQGYALSSMASSEAVFEMTGLGSHQPRTIPQQVLSDIIQPRAEEIAHFVKNEIRNAGFEKQACAGIVLTGGGSMLRGFPELIEGVLDMPVRIGTASGFGDKLLEKMPHLMGPEFATAAGLVLFGDRRWKKHDFHESSNSSFKKFVTKFRSFLL